MQLIKNSRHCYSIAFSLSMLKCVETIVVHDDDDDEGEEEGNKIKEPEIETDFVLRTP